MNAYNTNRYAERLLSMYKATNDNHVRQTIDLEWRAAWADLLRQYHKRLIKRLWFHCISPSYFNGYWQ